jgi:choline monooxygenase
MCSVRDSPAFATRIAVRSLRVSLRPFRIDPDIARAATPPGELYGGRDWFDAQRERLWPRSWHLTRAPRGTPAAGEAWPFVLFEGGLGEPLVLTRDAERRLRCLSNVCTHRGRVVVDRPCTGLLRCAYHGRAFHPDGRLASAPGFDGAEAFPTERDDLPRAACADWRGFAFAGLRPQEPFERYVAPLERRIGFVLDDRWPSAPATTRDYEFDANWALYVDNYLEGFHVPYVHPSLARTLDLRAYSIEVFEHGSVQIGRVREGEPYFVLPPGHPEAGQRVGAYFFFLFPCTLLNFYPWGMSINLVEPLAPMRTRVTFQSYVREPALVDVGAGADLDRVEQEDEAVVLATQRGVRAGLYRQGRYAPQHEACVHAFHRLLVHYLCERQAAPSSIDL